jgi:hypothetical protein
MPPAAIDVNRTKGVTFCLTEIRLIRAETVDKKSGKSVDDCQILRRRTPKMWACPIRYPFVTTETIRTRQDGSRKTDRVRIETSDS